MNDKTPNDYFEFFSEAEADKIRAYIESNGDGWQEKWETDLLAWCIYFDTCNYYSPLPSDAFFIFVIIFNSVYFYNPIFSYWSCTKSFFQYAWFFLDIYKRRISTLVLSSRMSQDQSPRGHQRIYSIFNHRCKYNIEKALNICHKIKFRKILVSFIIIKWNWNMQWTMSLNWFSLLDIKIF